MRHMFDWQMVHHELKYGSCSVRGRIDEQLSTQVGRHVIGESVHANWSRLRPVMAIKAMLEVHERRSVCLRRT